MVPRKRITSHEDNTKMQKYPVHKITNNNP